MWAFQGLSCIGSEIRWVKCRKTCYLLRLFPLPQPDRWRFLLTRHLQHLLRHFDSNLHVTTWKVSCHSGCLLSVWSWEVNFLDAQLDWWVPLSVSRFWGGSRRFAGHELWAMTVCPSSWMGPLKRHERHQKQRNNATPANLDGRKWICSWNVYGLFNDRSLDHLRLRTDHYRLLDCPY